MDNRKIKTIVVDDESRIRRGIERLVKTSGDEFEIVCSFGSGIEFMNAFQQDKIRFDLLITDIKMPGMDGLELIKELKKRTSFEAMVISGFNDFKFLQTAIREGAIDYMVKPLIRDEFRTQLGKIKEKIQKNWVNEEKIEQLDSELTYAKQIQRLSELTKDQVIDLAELEWTKDFPQGRYFLLYISIDYNSSNHSLLDEKTFHERLKSFYEDRISQFWTWKGEESSYWILIQSENKEIQEIILAEKLLSTIKQETQGSATIALSRVFQELALISFMKEELFSLLQFRLIYGENKAYTFSTMEKNLMDKGKIKESKELEIVSAKILDSLVRSQKEEVFYHLEQFFKELKKMPSPQEIERNIQVLSIQTVNLLLKKVYAKEEIILVQEAIQLTKRSPNFIVLKNNLRDWMQKVFAILEKMNQQEMTDPVEAAKKWIVDNLGDNITIDKIAKEVHMNATYFCEYFKSQTGETVLDYVTKARIEKARELLSSTDLKIYDISQQVGYADTKYFSKLFKKYFGEVPSKFRAAGPN